MDAASADTCMHAFLVPQVRLNERGLAAESKAIKSKLALADSRSNDAYANAAKLFTDNTGSDRTCMLM